MGANQSAVYDDSNDFSGVVMPRRFGRILSFSSSSKWKSHLQVTRKTNKLMVIHFTAAWCGPCRTMDPVIREFAGIYAGVEFIKIDVDELEDVAREYAVQALPAFVLIKKGKAVDKVVGAEKIALQKKIETYMN
ncbi:hypothetical protein DCAR_0208044 [Daucus carota subsp. sativus]|uniref:Thioredoxin domain-containing protein n=1 Tax=Daucus carota subsp. sativus TaxID=79200 RepID=A0A166EA44_DAUCS|nr:PREDICTED: thioredoxin H2-like [Daucus carota subsp. sativus]XP_017235954.1 PREDICTED: thioredoxin H2-like [Daucus carota subsp. sativus]WOG88809.1 hypothetical protein DCAR_0208044 [Daucus carota subsp. sativus]